MEGFIRKLNNVKIGTRLIFLITILIVTSIVVGVVGYSSLDKLNNANDRMYTENINAINSITSFKANMIEIQSEIRSMCLTFDKAKINKSMSMIKENIQEDDILLANYKKTCSTANDKELVAQLENDLEKYRISRDKLLEFDFLDSKQSQQVKTMQESNSNLFDAVEKDLNKIQNLNINYAKDSWKETTVLFNSSVKIVVGIIIVIVILASIIGILMVKSITLPIQLLNKLLSKIANRDLTENAPTDYGAEFGQMFKAFNHMNGNLREIIGNVVLSSNIVKDASENVVEKNEQTQIAMGDIITLVSDLSNEMTQQTLNLKESSKAMNEMAMGVQNIVESSTSVTQMSMETSNEVESGNKLMQQTMRQMNSINNVVDMTNKAVESLISRTSDIAKSLQSITEISDQTNLLALNASIEAARAGEQGKGFAVVAEEVRKLAEQSRVSVQDISKLLEKINEETNNVTKATAQGKVEVQSGIASVEQVRETFEKITESIGQVASEMNGVSSTTEEMSAGIEEVTASIADISSSSEKLSRESEQTAQTATVQGEVIKEATNLSIQSKENVEKLERLVNEFRV